MKCSCPVNGPAAKFQEQEYGKGNRLHNPCGSKGAKKARCTVCGKEKTL